MGQLVFQATLGGQVNLVGPNTASTYNINVPAVAGNMVTTGDTGTVTSTMLSTTTLTASAATTASSNKGAFNYGTLGFSDTGIVASYQTSVNSYFQNVIQNTSNGTAASSEFIAYNDQGTATTNFAAVGINSSGYSGTGSINAAGYAYFLSGSTDLVLGTIGSNKIHFTINSGATDAMLIDTAGKVGIGTSSPGTNLTIGNGGGSSNLGVTLSRGATTNFFEAYDGTKTMIAGTDNSNDFVKIGSLSSHPVGFVTANAERARIDASGNLLLNTTSSFASARLQIKSPSSTAAIATQVFNNGDNAINWYNASGSYVASIVVNSGTIVYGTVSDYRLKENIVPMTGALDKVAALKPCTYTWKDSGDSGQGFIAHELQEIIPDAVSGQKDALHKDGTPKLQGVDTSFVVATLTAAIQELKAIVDTQAAKIAALEAK